MTKDWYAHNLKHIKQSFQGQKGRDSSSSSAVGPKNKAKSQDGGWEQISTLLGFLGSAIKYGVFIEWGATKALTA